MSDLIHKVQALARLRCSIFQTSYNPTGQRTGAKYLRARLRGPSMVAYYPRAIPNMAAVRAMVPEMLLPDPVQEQRFEDVEARKRRGKGPPKKAKEKVDAKKGQVRKKKK